MHRITFSVAISPAPAITALALAALLAVPTPAVAEPGEELFTSKGCFVCHTIGGGKLVGPDLRGVSERRDADWIVEFVQFSQSMVAAGDETAVALFDEFKVPMPDQAVSREEILAIMAFTSTGTALGPLAQAGGVETAPTEEEIALGGNIFEGTRRLANGGTACNACHDVKNDAVIGGGVLAAELTSVFSRLGGPGVRAILGSPPFPVMQAAYKDKPLTEDEVAALVGFLQEADAEQNLQQPRDYGVKLFGSGVLGTFVLLAFNAVVWRRRKSTSVNQSIYDRQVKSS